MTGKEHGVHVSVCGCVAPFRTPFVVLREKAVQFSGVQQRQAVHRPCVGDVEQTLVNSLCVPCGRIASSHSSTLAICTEVTDTPQVNQVLWCEMRFRAILFESS